MPGAVSGPAAYGAYLQPARLCGLDLSGDDEPKLVRDTVREKGTKVHWRSAVESAAIVLTHGGGVFALFAERAAENDPAARMKREMREAVDLLNMVVCELALACDVPCSAFSPSDIAVATYSDDPARCQTWAAMRPYAPQSMRHEADMREGSGWVAAWDRSSAEDLKALGDLPLARNLHAIASDLPALVAGAVGHHHRGRAAEATLFGWMVCERLVHHVWATRVQPTALSGAHATQLSDGRTYTAAVRIEILRREGWLNDEDFLLVSSARKARNEQAHNRPATPEDAHTTLHAMLAVLESVLHSDS